MNNQEAFDKVCDHLMQMIVPSKEDGLCVYRGENGLKCAIGTLIPDELYFPSLESYGSVNDLMNTTAKELEPIQKLFKGLNLNLLIDLQIIHDSSISWTKKGLSKEAIFKLKETAQRYELKINF